MLRAVLPLVIPVVLLSACGGGEATESTKAEAEAKADAKAETKDDPAAEAKGRKISMREQDGLRGPVRRMVETELGIEVVCEFDCAGNALRVGTVTFEWTFDERGCPVSAKTALGPAEAECDASGRPIRVRSLDGMGRLEHVFEHEYDVQGHETLRRKVAAGGKVIFETKWQYDDRGNEILEEHTVAGGEPRITTTEYVYSDDGSKTATVTEGDERRRIHYGAHGFVEREEQLDAEGKATEVERYAYELDERGNWIKRGTPGEDGETEWRVTRTLEYCE